MRREHSLLLLLAVGGVGLIAWLSRTSSAAAAGSTTGDGMTDVPSNQSGPLLRNLNRSNSSEADRLAAFLPYFQKADADYFLPPGLTQRIAYIESRYDPQARSPAGAEGIMQLEPSSFPSIDRFDPLASIDAGAAYLGQLYQQFQAWPLAIAAYNAGPGNVEKYGGVPPFAETQAYVANVAGVLGLA